MDVENGLFKKSGVSREAGEIKAPNGTNGIGKNGAFCMVISLLCVGLTIFQIFGFVTGRFPAMEQRSIFLGMILSITLLIHIRDKWQKGVVDLWSLFLLAGTVFATAYAFLNWNGMAFRVIRPERLDLIVGFLLLASVINCANVRLGRPLPIIAMAFFFYALLGNKIGGSMGTGSFTIQRVVSVLTMETSGIYGTILGTAARQIFVFILFGSFLEISGAGRFFLQLAGALFGSLKGSGAKVNTVAGGLLGMVSGSAVANVMAVGPMTVPMMEKDGFSKKFCGAVSAISGTGGQLMPPVMGTAAFIMAETLAIPYGDVTKSALIPGILFYLAIWISINFHSNRLGLKRSREKTEWLPIFKQGYYYFIPLIFLIVAISVWGFTPVKAGLWSTVLLIGVSWLNRESRMGFCAIREAMEQTAKNALTVTVACAVAGIMVGILSLTGLGLKLSTVLLTLSGGRLMALLIFTMIAGLIMGMGMTTTSVYIVLSVLVAPALVDFGVYPIAAHLFVFYFGILSCITPPVATAVFASAGLVGESPVKLGFYTAKRAIPIYVIPFLFVLNPELLLIGNHPLVMTAEIILSALIITALCGFVEGAGRREFTLLRRILLLAFSALGLSPFSVVKLISGLGILLLLWENYRKGPGETGKLSIRSVLGSVREE